MDAKTLYDFGFVLPHWFYWGWLVVSPIILIIWSYYLENKKKQRGELVVTKEEEGSNGPAPSNAMTRVIDWICEHTGQMVGFWTITAVCFYAFEVISRYIFNKPTIWVHESSFLLFGMQYLLAGAYAYLHNSHVAVDIVFARLPPRGRYGMDVFTSVFSFIFFIVLIGTSWKFFMNSLGMRERTVETWQIQYYPVKGIMVVGSILITLAAISKLYKDIKLFNQLGRNA
ncbi:TRAP transporter small permease subunit [Desulfofustis glycolicus]|uniref:TRAP-type mannitol/chloroaromatic compound transport system, small permease component n=1 Tax=Desulfofustis glycolicus DSM 9705 TaxID=1121409 RepID=A0A1M5T6D3_9BACT|nr:TRAP transporter small permease subunit [Desulfofustis glycolicus]MCB2215387.1 TRAP transporter small permease subunit [Desulfobulbaceae bacterium]SHH46311.1 TRAP-type mannitol/chloroaromatic compound transport system, small permease component [Desulfofustis glycolicus DSM 9705]